MEKIYHRNKILNENIWGFESKRFYGFKFHMVNGPFCSTSISDLGGIPFESKKKKMQKKTYFKNNQIPKQKMKQMNIEEHNAKKITGKIK